MINFYQIMKLEYQADEVEMCSAIDFKLLCREHQQGSSIKRGAIGETGRLNVGLISRQKYLLILLKLSVRSCQLLSIHQAVDGYLKRSTTIFPPHQLAMLGDSCNIHGLDDN